MSQEERFKHRRFDYSAWHRRNSTKRYVGIEKAQLLAMIDLDAGLYVEYDDGTKEPLALIEAAQDDGQNIKPATVMAKLAQKANMPGYVVLYKLTTEQNPADPQWQDIEQFRIKRVYPDPEKEWRVLTPQEYAEGLINIRQWSARQLDANKTEQ